MAKGTNNKPVKALRMGLLSASIWENEADGRRYHNVTFSRSYKVGEEWKHSDSFGTDDLLPLAKLADLAHTAIYRLRDDAKKAEGER